jgi:hypothetical protein
VESQVGRRRLLSRSSPLLAFDENGVLMLGRGGPELLANESAA